MSFTPNTAQLDVYASNQSFGGSLSSATSVAAALGAILVIDRNFTLTGATTLSARGVRFAGGIITTAGFNIQINGPVEAPAVRIFNTSGGGTVSFIQSNIVFPEWWGADNTGADSTDAFADMADSLNSVGGGTVLLQAGVYRPGNPTFTKPTLIKGAGALGPGASSPGFGTRVNAVSGGQAFTFSGSAGLTFGGGLEDLGIQSDNSVGGVVQVFNTWYWHCKNVVIWDGNGSLTTTDAGIVLTGYCFETLIEQTRILAGSDGCIVLQDDAGIYPNSTVITNGCDFSPQNGGCAILDGGAVHLVISNNHFEYASGGGKAIRIFGSGTYIAGNSFGANTSSSAAQISLEGSSHDVTIADNPLMYLASGSTGNGSIIDIGSGSENVTIVGNTMDVSQGGWAVNNNGAPNVVVSDNSINVSGSSATGCILVRNAALQGVIANNVIRGNPSVPVGSVIGIQVNDACLMHNVLGNNVQGIDEGINLLDNTGTPTVIFASNIITNNTTNVTITDSASVMGDNTNNIYS